MFHEKSEQVMTFWKMEDHESYAQDSNHLLKYQLLVQRKGSEVSVISMF